MRGNNKYDHGNNLQNRKHKNKSCRPKVEGSLISIFVFDRREKRIINITVVIQNLIACMFLLLVVV